MLHLMGRNRLEQCSMDYFNKIYPNYTGSQSIGSGETFLAEEIEETEEKKSLIDRKRPVVEGLIEDLLGPASLLDEIISSNPVPLVMDGKSEVPVDNESDGNV